MERGTDADDRIVRHLGHLDHLGYLDSLAFMAQLGLAPGHENTTDPKEDLACPF